MTRILIIDDEESIRNVLRLNLRARGYETEEAWSAAEAMAKIAEFQPHLMILDLGLPDAQGGEVLTKIRAWSKVPIIILTVTDDEQTKVTLLEAGADDYLTKPFSLPELLARVKVALRHYQDEAVHPVFVSGDLRVDLVGHEVTKGGKAARLTATEYALLRILIKHGGRVVPQELILQEIWGPHGVDNPHYVRIYIGQLRKKLEAKASMPEHILTEPGLGYRLV